MSRRQRLRRSDGAKGRRRVHVEHFVGQLEVGDGGAPYGASCHHRSTIFLHRKDKHAVAKYVDSEYVDQLRRRDGKKHGCGTCHGPAFNPRFLPRASDPPGYPPVAERGMQP